MHARMLVVRIFLIYSYTTGHHAVHKLKRLNTNDVNGERKIEKVCLRRFKGLQDVQEAQLLLGNRAKRKHAKDS